MTSICPSCFARSTDIHADRGTRWAAAATRQNQSLPALFVIDEPFSGTNPALRVPIAVEVLDHLATRDLVVAATHDLDVAAQVNARFVRAYFREPDEESGHFDHKLRPGVSPGSNALALLIQAGYPQEIIAAVERRVTDGNSKAERSRPPSDSPAPAG